MPEKQNKTVLIATIRLLGTTIIWASTFVLDSMVIGELGPITLAGLRFFFAGLILVIYLWIKKFDFTKLKGYWLRLLLLGVLSFSIGNAAVYISLQYLPSTTVSLMMNFVTPIVIIFGALWLKEAPSKIHSVGVAMALAGTVFFFYPQQIPVSNPGFLILISSLFAFGGYTILGRSLARASKINYLAQTAFPLLFGGGILLVAALFLEGIPAFSPRTGLIVLWMIVINSILGYILYNQAIIHLTAVKTNVILNLAPFFTAIIAFFVLGEQLRLQQILAMVIIFAGTYLVQSQTERKPTKSPDSKR